MYLHTFKIPPQHTPKVIGEDKPYLFGTSLSRLGTVNCKIMQ